MSKETREQALESLRTVFQGIQAIENDIIESNTVEEEMETFHKLQELNKIYRESYSVLLRDLSLKYDDQVVDKSILLTDAEKKLRSMGATWFVSYAFYNYCDKSHRNWEKAETLQPRFSSYNNGQKYIKIWLNKVLEMNDNNLRKNQIDLEPADIKRMAREVISKLS